MISSTIDVNKIRYTRNKLYYLGKILAVESPIMKCITAVEKYYNRYQITLELPIDDEGNEFLQLIRDIEDNNKKYCDEDAIYRSQIRKSGDAYQIVLKIPFRFNKFEILVTSKDRQIAAPTTKNLIPGTLVQCKIEISNIWNFVNDDNQKIAGCIFLLKFAEIV